MCEPAFVPIKLSERQSEWTREGRFWLPGSEQKATGIIDYSPERGAGVRLFDSELMQPGLDQRYGSQSTSSTARPSMDGR